MDISRHLIKGIRGEIIKYLVLGGAGGRGGLTPYMGEGIRLGFFRCLSAEIALSSSHLAAAAKP